MCGIVGIVDLAGGNASAELLLAMSGAIGHRGPDDEGYAAIDTTNGLVRAYAGPSSSVALRGALGVLGGSTFSGPASIVLGHRRFSIVDLSDAGHQPFVDDAGACCVIFNGEIYNHRELRTELEADGVRFRTHSDTEVLVEGYKRWGTACFERFNGFWALALYDLAKRRLILSRDRIGKKPLFWTRIGTAVYFASEIKALLRVPQVNAARQVNEAAVAGWLTYGRKDQGTSTCFEGIHAHAAGSWSILDERFPGNTVSFWRVPEHRLREQDISVEEAARGVRDILRDSVRLRLQADVGVSVELSGGMDSSTLVALASEIAPGRVTTYTVRFPGEAWNEEPFARTVAERFQVDYRVLDPPVEDFWSDIGAFTRLQEEPYHAPNLHTNQLIWSRMREFGTKVSLNGAAGDELFAGYGVYYAPAQIENLREGRWGAFVDNARGYSESRGRLDAWWHPAVAALRGTARSILPDALLARAQRPDFVRGLPAVNMRRPFASLSRVLHTDMTDALMPYWLRSGDRGYMGVPVEVRAPFLDYRLIDFAFQLPTTYLVRDGWHKWILRKAMSGILPDDVIWRRRKLGFPFPFDRFYADSRPVVDALLEGVDNPYIDGTMATSFRSHWKVLSFLLWYELFFNDNEALLDRLGAIARRDGSRADAGFRPEFLRSCA